MTVFRPTLAVTVALLAAPVLEPERESGWGGKRLEAADFVRIRAAGFDTVRIPVRWSNKTGQQPDYAIDPEWLARVTEVVDQALAADLNVILNDHNFEALHEQPQANRDKLAAIWRQVAAHFADRPVGRLGFEIENEPHHALTNDNLVAKLDAYIARTGLTPFMGETGSYDGGTSLAERIQYHAAVREAFAPTGIGTCAWAYTNTFPFWDREKGQWLPGLRAAFGLPEGEPGPRTA